MNRKREGDRLFERLNAIHECGLSGKAKYTAQMFAIIAEFLVEKGYQDAAAALDKAFEAALGSALSDAEEARGLTCGWTALEAGLKLRYAADEAEYRVALAVLKKKLDRDSPAREGLVMWVRSSMIEAGAKEEDVAKVQRLEDLGEPVVDSWFAKELRESRRKSRAEGLEEGRELGRREAEARERQNQRAMLVRQAERKFSVEVANELAALLKEVSGPDRLAEVADLIIDCTSGPELLARAAETA